MGRYEYKIVDLPSSGYWKTSVRHEELLEVLNREGRTGWKFIVTQQPGPVRWNSVLLCRQVD